MTYLLSLKCYETFSRAVVEVRLLFCTNFSFVHRSSSTLAHVGGELGSTRREDVVAALALRQEVLPSFTSNISTSLLVSFSSSDLANITPTPLFISPTSCLMMNQTKISGLRLLQPRVNVVLTLT